MVDAQVPVDRALTSSAAVGAQYRPDVDTTERLAQELVVYPAPMPDSLPGDGQEGGEGVNTDIGQWDL